MAAQFSEQEVLAAAAASKAGGTLSPRFQGVSTDSRKASPGCLFLALRGDRFDGHDFLAQAAAAGAAGAIVQRGRKRAATPDAFALYEVDETLRALGALAHFHRRRFSAPLAAITGSNGKTTAKEMAHAILSTRGPALKSEGNLNNEIGLPLTLFRLGPEHVAAAVEMGMSHLGEIERLTAIARPEAGLITSIQPAHLKTLGTLQGVARAKGELFRGLRPEATAVVNLDDPRVVEQAEALRARRLTFGRSERADVRLLRIESQNAAGLRVWLGFRGRERVVRLAFVGEHNAHNAAAAFALGCAMDYLPDECVAGLEKAQPEAHRLRLIPAPGGVTVLDDCYNANPSSMAAGLQTLRALARSGRAVAALGDMLELGEAEEREHRALGELAAKSAPLLAFFGPRCLASARAAAAGGATCAHFEEVDALLGWLRPRLRAGDLVLVKASRGMRLERVVDGLTGSTSEVHP